MVSVENTYNAHAEVSAGRDTGKDFQVNEPCESIQYMVKRGEECSVVTESDGGESAPLLVSDDGESTDYESDVSVNGGIGCERPSHDKVRIVEAAERVKKDMKSSQECNVSTELTEKQFRLERKQLMTIIVKYMASKIVKAFPLELPGISRRAVPIEKVLFVLTYRLGLSLTSFMRGMIYLFRYMDIIYLLRYLNQSNNFANYNGVDFLLNKLIIGCFRLALDSNGIQKDWTQITGLPESELSQIVQTLVIRMNAKTVIKSSDLTRFKLEIYRFVKMVTNPI